MPTRNAASCMRTRIISSALRGTLSGPKDGTHPIGTDRPDQGGLIASGRLDDFPVGHFRFTDGLTINRPRRPMIMGEAVFRSLINVRANAELIIRVLIQDAAFLVGIRGQIFCDQASSFSACSTYVRTFSIPAGRCLRPRHCDSRRQIHRAYKTLNPPVVILTYSIYRIRQPKAERTSGVLLFIQFANRRNGQGRQKSQGREQTS